MRFLRYFGQILFVLAFIMPLSAQNELDFETVSVMASDNLELVGDIYLPDDIADIGNPAVLLFHMLGGSRSAYEPLIPDLLDAGYIIVNADMRGHGDTGGNQEWELTVEDVQVWLDWMREYDAIDSAQIAIIGGSIGSNVALMGCANDTDCVGAIALSPGLDYRGVQPETAVVEGLADRAVLLVASHLDRYSAETIEQLFTQATGNISARMYSGSGHGTNLFRTEYESVSHLILSWLAEHLKLPDA